MSIRYIQHHINVIIIIIVIDLIITISTSSCNLNKVSILLSYSHQSGNVELNIAKGTTDPGVD